MFLSNRKCSYVSKNRCNLWHVLVFNLGPGAFTRWHSLAPSHMMACAMGRTHAVRLQEGCRVLGCNTGAHSPKRLRLTQHTLAFDLVSGCWVLRDILLIPESPGLHVYWYIPTWMSRHYLPFSKLRLLAKWHPVQAHTHDRVGQGPQQSKRHWAIHQDACPEPQVLTQGSKERQVIHSPSLYKLL